MNIVRFLSHPVDRIVRIAERDVLVEDTKMKKGDD